MREGKSYGGNDQGDTDQKERQGDHSSTAAAPHVDIEAIKPPRVPDSPGGGNSEQKPHVSKSHIHESKGAGNERTRKFRRLLTPQWVSALSALTATFVAIAALAVSVFGYLDMQSSSAQTEQLVAAAKKQADAIKDLRDLAAGQLDVIKGQLEAATRQHEMTVIQTRANIRKEGIRAKPIIENGIKTGWLLNSFLRNVGGTDAVDFAMWWGIARTPHRQAGDAEGCPAIKSSFGSRKMVMTPGEVIIQAGIGLPVEDVVRAANNEIDIFAIGRVEYRDIFPNTPTHRYEWCVRVVPNNINEDVFSFINVAENKE